MVFFVGCRGVDTAVVDQRLDVVVDFVEELIELEYVEQRTEFFEAEDEVRVGDWEGVGAGGKLRQFGFLILVLWRALRWF